MDSQEIERRARHAQDLFRQGFNCAQAVFAACADLYGIKEEQLALRLAASFGGGIGRMHMVCGAASGMFLLAGLHNGSATPHDNEGKMANYELVQNLASQYKNTYGSLVCAELLGLKPCEDKNAKLNKQPCIDMVAQAVRIFLNYTHNK